MGVDGEAARRKANRTRRQAAIAAWYRELKRELVCACGEDHPACIVFHHPDPAAKEISVSDAVRRGWGRDRILAEIAKCEVVCANCHAKRHARRIV